MGQKLPYLDVLGSNFQKLLSYLHSQICQNANFHAKLKKLKYVSAKKYLIWVFLGRVLKETTVIFEISSSIYNEESRPNSFILIICCWCSAKDREKVEGTHSKKLRKKLLFNYSPWSIYTRGKLLTMSWSLY